MKATGVVRRIDDLGRIVLPKELRRSMRIKEGESLEIYTDGENRIILKKYSPVQNVNDFVEEFVESLYASNKKDIIITDNVILKIIAINFVYIGKKTHKELKDDIIDAGINRICFELICKTLRTNTNIR